MPEENKLYIVTRAHNQDYLSSMVYLTQSISENQAIINCMEYEDLGFEEEEEYKTELDRLQSLSLDELEQDDRDNGNAWSAELFILPVFDKDNLVYQIAKLDTD